MNWFMNLLSGWLPIGVNSAGEKKSIGEWAGKILWVVGIVVALMFIDKVFNKPPTTTLQAGSTQVIYQGEQRDLMGIGCNAWRLYLKGGVRGK
jgi:hypothetical protein